MDEVGHSEEALGRYLEAVELCLSTREGVEEGGVREVLGGLARQALERAEELKGGHHCGLPQFVLPVWSNLWATSTWGRWRWWRWWGLIQSLILLLIRSYPHLLLLLFICSRLFILI